MRPNKPKEPKEVEVEDGGAEAAIPGRQRDPPRRIWGELGECIQAGRIRVLEVTLLDHLSLHFALQRVSKLVVEARWGLTRDVRDRRAEAVAE